MDTSNLHTISCQENHYDPMPETLLTLEGLHDTTMRIATTEFRKLAGTDRMVPTLLITVHEKEKLVRVYPCEWTNERAKSTMLKCMNVLFNDPLLRPDRYCFQGEVWIANVSADEYDGRPASMQPNRLDGLTIISVEADPKVEAIFTSYVRRPTEDGFLVEFQADSRRERDKNPMQAFEGRLAELFKPLPPGEGEVRHKFM
jgi:hypothetical protein